MGRARIVVRLLLSAALVTPAALAGAGTATATSARVPTLVGIRAAHHPTYDRVVFDFTGGVPSRHWVRYVSPLRADASGKVVPVAGRAILAVTMSPTNAHTPSGVPTAPAKIAFALPNVMTVVRAGDFEAVTTYGIGLAKKESFHVFTLRHPDRLVIDIRSTFRTVWKKVYFFNQRRYLANTEPFFTPVLRPVRPWTPATGGMDRTIAGPTPREYAHGRRLLSSKATGFTRLRINNGIARVQLTGGCSSGGSTVSIAGEIMPSLRQFATVDHVKIYDPWGRTESPWGHTDSIPECLEP
jgi:hypothetical protein